MSDNKKEQCTIQNVMSFGYEYFMEVDVVMKKVADSRMLTLAQENEEMYARRFREEVVNGKIKGYIKDCAQHRSKRNSVYPSNTKV